MKKSSRKIEKIINAPINEAFLTNVYFGGVNLLNADLFRLIDYNLTDEEFEDFKRRGVKI